MKTTIAIASVLLFVSASSVSAQDILRPGGNGRPGDLDKLVQELTDQGKDVTAISFNDAGAWAVFTSDGFRRAGGNGHPSGFSEFVERIPEREIVTVVAFHNRGWVVGTDSGTLRAGGRDRPGEMDRLIERLGQEGRTISAVEFNEAGAWVVATKDGFSRGGGNPRPPGMDGFIQSLGQRKMTVVGMNRRGWIVGAQ